MPTNSKPGGGGGIEGQSRLEKENWGVMRVVLGFSASSSRTCKEEDELFFVSIVQVLSEAPSEKKA